MRKILFISLFLLIHFIGFTQDLSFYGFLPAWSQTGRINNRVAYNLFLSTTIDAFEEKIAGISYPAKDFQLYFQPSVIYKFSADLNTSFSYTYQRNNPITDDYSNEHRFWQQIVYAHNLGIGRMSHRVRFEERFIQNRLTNEYPISTRLRYQIGFSIPLKGKTLDPKEFYLNTYNEFYFSISGQKNADYSENWSYLGAGYVFNSNQKIELGYLLQVGVRNQAKDLRFLNMMQVAYITSFDFF